MAQSTDHKNEAIKRTDEFRILIRQVMRRRGLTNADLARRTGVSPTQLSRLFRDGKPWTLEKMIQVAAALELDLAIELAPTGEASVRDELEGLDATLLPTLLHGSYGLSPHQADELVKLLQLRPAALIELLATLQRPRGAGRGIDDTQALADMAIRVVRDGVSRRAAAKAALPLTHGQSEESTVRRLCRKYLASREALEEQAHQRLRPPAEASRSSTTSSGYVGGGGSSPAMKKLVRTAREMLGFDREALDATLHPHRELFEAIETQALKSQIPEAMRRPHQLAEEAVRLARPYDALVKSIHESARGPIDPRSLQTEAQKWARKLESVRDPYGLKDILDDD